MNQRMNEGAPRESLMIPPTVVPPFVREIGRRARDIGLSHAVVEVFEDAQITFEVEGDHLTDTDGKGILIASDHQQTIEPWFSQGLMGVSDRPASHVIGKPSSLQCRLIDHISEPEEGLILPVIPGTFAAEKRGKEMLNNDTWARIRHSSLVRPKAELASINQAAMDHATRLVGEQRAVTIYPTGTTEDAAKAPWRRGVGSIVQGLRPEAHDDTQLVLLSPEGASKSKLISALTLRHLGIRPRPQTVVLRTANLGTPRELFGDTLTSDHPKAAQAMTDTMREHYLERFAA